MRRARRGGLGRTWKKTTGVIRGELEDSCGSGGSFTGLVLFQPQEEQDES